MAISKLIFNGETQSGISAAAQLNNNGTSYYYIAIG